LPKGFGWVVLGAYGCGAAVVAFGYGGLLLAMRRRRGDYAG
jgi:hypothetical protein